MHHSFLFISARRGSNPRPPPWQGGAPPLSHSRMLHVTNKGEYTITFPVCQAFFFIIPAKSQNSSNPQNSSRSKKSKRPGRVSRYSWVRGTKTMLRAHKSCPSPIRCIKRRNRGVEFHKENLTESDIRLDILP